MIFLIYHLITRGKGIWIKKIIAESLNYIENNIKDKITIDEIASNAGYTKFYFSRLFKQEMNVSIMEYVRERK